MTGDSSGEPLTGLTARADLPEPGWAVAAGAELRQVFPGEECQLRVMRRWLTAGLPGCPVLDDVVSVASELGSNAIRHSATGRDGKFIVEVESVRDFVRGVIELSVSAGHRGWP
jgi:hypothetical protein